MVQKKLSWLGYMDVLQQRSFTTDQLQTDNLEQILKLNHFTPSVFSHNIPWIYLLDYTTGKYLSISKSVKRILGYDPDYLLDGGLDLTKEKYQPEHLHLLDKEIFPDKLEIILKIPQNEQSDYIFSHNFQFKTKKGEYINLVQRSSFIKSDEKGNPLISLGVISNIDQYKRNSPVIQIVEKVSSITGSVDTLLKNSYYLHKEDQVFSNREMEILAELAEGLTSKEIADKLFISEFTVINHKRNMHCKSNTQNSAALVNFAFKQHLL